jgi:ketosteroid isomerase-like protein
MSAEDLAVARQFIDTLAAAAKSGDIGEVYPLLDPDVHWMTPQRDLRGVAEVSTLFSWFSPDETRHEVEFEIGKLADLGGGKFATDFQEIYRTKQTGEFAYARDRRIVLTIREGKIASYEMRFGT